MDLRDKNIGFAMTGSFCTFSRVIKELERLTIMGANVYPIMSEISYSTDTRFGTCADFREKIEGICQKPIIKSIKEAEPIGPKRLLDLLIIAPCTGTTLGKLAHGISDTTVTLATKAHLRNGRPVLIAPSTNDGLAASAPNLGILMVRKYMYFVPFHQDDPFGKPASLVSDFSLIPDAAEAALTGTQLQPILLSPVVQR